MTNIGQRLRSGVTVQLVSDHRAAYDSSRLAMADEYSNPMKLHRSIALALTGWSLMLPPASHTLRLEMTKDLSKWNIHSTHATEAECEQEKARLQASVAETASNAPRTTLRRPGRDMLAARYRNARCVSSDDPALKAR